MTLLYAKHGKNGDMLGLSGDYNVLEKGKSANLSAQYSHEEQFASYTACIIDSFKNLAVYTADEYSVSGEKFNRYSRKQRHGHGFAERKSSIRYSFCKCSYYGA
ncbi:MAG: hypothetical protein L6V93_05820 [Clostridiales bacterium]|nr:MAG: hypothetical protein L6V93_05820 [Clostridiales bacterium]